MLLISVESALFYPSVQLENLTGAVLIAAAGGNDAARTSYSPNRMYRALRAIPELLGLGTLNPDQVFS